MQSNLLKEMRIEKEEEEVDAILFTNECNREKKDMRIETLGFERN